MYVYGKMSYINSRYNTEHRLPYCAVVLTDSLDPPLNGVAPARVPGAIPTTIAHVFTQPFVSSPLAIGNRMHIRPLALPQCHGVW